ncbi:pyridoxal phosphate-dependent aminotransferase [Chloroflexota bacterium]
MTIAKHIRNSLEEGSFSRRMFEEGIALKQQYGAENVFDLSLGNPMMEPPPEFNQELRKLVEHPLPGMHRYMPNAGYPEARVAVAEQLSKETNIKFTMHEVIMTCGAAGALNVVLKTILNPGEEVILFAPYFTEYRNFITNQGGVTTILPTDERFLPELDILETTISPKTRALIINSPNNPTGVVYSDELLSQMGEIIRKKEAQYKTEIFLISDEPYRKIIYDGLKYPPPSHHHPRSIIVSSHSKDLSLPGERIGYIAINHKYDQRREMVDGFIFCNLTLGFVNAPALMQHIVSHLQSVTVPAAAYQRNRDLLYGNLIMMGYSVRKPQGAFYMFPKIPIEDDMAFVDELKQRKVLVVPGIGFGVTGHFRISYCVDDRTLEGALDGLRNVAQKFNLGSRNHG